MSTNSPLPHVQLDPTREDRIQRRLVRHFTDLNYPDVDNAASWSLSLVGAASRFRSLVPYLSDCLKPEGDRQTVNGAARGPRLLVSGMGSGSEMVVARNIGFGEIHGTEVDPFYVTLVADRLTGHPGFLPMLVDGKETPYADGSFDVVVSGHIVEHTADPFAYISENLRVLRPGGYFLIEFPTRFHFRELHTGLPSLEWLPERIRTGVLAGVGWKRGIGVLPFSERSRRLSRAIIETGLKQVSLRRVRRWVHESSVRTKWIASGRPGPGVVWALFRREL